MRVQKDACCCCPASVLRAVLEGEWRGNSLEVGTFKSDAGEMFTSGLRAATAGTATIAGVAVATATGEASPCLQLLSGCMCLLSLCGSTLNCALDTTALQRAASAERTCSKTTKV